MRGSCLRRNDGNFRDNDAGDCNVKGGATAVQWAFVVGGGDCLCYKRVPIVFGTAWKFLLEELTGEYAFRRLSCLVQRCDEVVFGNTL